MNNNFEDFDPLKAMGLTPSDEGEVSSDDLQRTDEWRQERCGNFTASKFKDLMTCKSRAKGKNWGNVKWVLDFGDTAINYILEKAIERATGQPIETQETWHMRWGNHYEPEGKAAFTKKYGVPIEEVGFIKFYKCAGASPDGELPAFLPESLHGVVSGERGWPVAFELKCPATVLSHYKLSTNPVDESHDYFWQVTGEMLALRTDRTIFCSYDPRYPDDFKLNVRGCFISDVHVRALKTRIIIADKVADAMAKDLNTDPRALIAEMREEIPEDYEDFTEWLNDTEKDYLI